MRLYATISLLGSSFVRDGLIDLVSAHLERREETIWIVCIVLDITARRLAEAAVRITKQLHGRRKRWKRSIN